MYTLSLSKCNCSHFSPCSTTRSTRWKQRYFLIKNRRALEYIGRDKTGMSDLLLLNKLFGCDLMLCRSESIIKEKDNIFKTCAEICLCQGESSWVMGEKRQKRLVEVEKWNLSRSQAFFYLFLLGSLGWVTGCLRGQAIWVKLGY